jgi:prepilin-type N-terminal cleavage/methylation domain-containing protein
MVNKHFSGRTGLSLLELVVVMLAIGIIAVAGSLRYADALIHHRLQSAAQAITAELQGVSALARTRSQSVTISVDPIAETFTVSGIENPDASSRPYIVNVQNRFACEIERSDFPIASPLIVNAFGHPSKAGAIVLKIGVSERSITVNHSQGTIQTP